MVEKRIIPKIPDFELDVMLVLWKYDRPVRISEIFHDLKDIRLCTKPAIHNLLAHLEKRGFVQIHLTDERQSYKQITPLVTKEEYRAAQADSFIKKLCGGKWQTLISTLIQTDSISREDLDEINQLLNAPKEGRK